MPSGKQPQKKPVKKTVRIRIITTRLPQQLVDEIDIIAKAEKSTRSNILHKAIEAFAFNYNTDQLDQRQLQLEKRMKIMENGLRALMVKSVRASGQALYFATLPYVMGPPKGALKSTAFQQLYDTSAKFALQFLQTKATGTSPTAGIDPLQKSIEQQSD
ncbi:MAG: hypothetical protein ACRD3W_21125 [Terriglobales bacterium]